MVRGLAFLSSAGAGPASPVGDIFRPLPLADVAIGSFLSSQNFAACVTMPQAITAGGDPAQGLRPGLWRGLDLVSPCGYLAAQATSALDRPGADPHNPCPHSSPGTPSDPPR